MMSILALIQMTLQGKERKKLLNQGYQKLFLTVSFFFFFLFLFFNSLKYIYQLDFESFDSDLSDDDFGNNKKKIKNGKQETFLFIFQKKKKKKEKKNQFS